MGDHDTPTSNSIECRTEENADGETEAQNPPPPTDVGLDSPVVGDAIGDTTFSQRWVLQSLMKLNEVIAQKTDSMLGKNDDDDDDIQELDSEIETSICQLWDMSVERAVVEYLLEVPTLDIIADAILHTEIPRLTEIAMGIIANIACVEKGLEKLTSHEKLRFQVLHLLDSSDPPTLTELFRMLSTAIQSEAHGCTWLTCIRNDENFLPQIIFVLASSTNVQLLTVAASFLDTVLDNDEELCVSWMTPEFVDSVLEAARQLNSIAAGAYLHILHVLSRIDGGSTIISHYADTVLKVACLYIARACSDAIIHTSASKIESGLGSALVLLYVLLQTADVSSTIRQLEKEKTMTLVLGLITSRHSESVEDTFLALCEEVVKQDEGEAMLPRCVQQNTEMWQRWAQQLCPGKLKHLIDSCPHLEGASNEKG